MEKLRPGIFLDRDGVINKNEHYPSGDIRGYVLGWDQFVFYEDVMDAFFAIYEMQKYDVFVASNQSGISRGLTHNGMPVTCNSIEKIFRQMEREITEEVRDTILCNSAVPGFPQLPLPKDGIIYTDRVIKQSRFCPHDESFGCCCRKPKPGMIYYLAVKWGIDLGRSWMIGDSHIDLAAGSDAGIIRLIKIHREAEPYIPGNEPVIRTVEGPYQGMVAYIPNLYNAIEYIKDVDELEKSIDKDE